VRTKNNLRRYGKSPFTVALIHGGPGAAGEMSPVAEELSKSFGVLEPLQTADSIGGQVEELRETLKRYSGGTATLVGYSWGAWLSYIVAAKYPEIVKKLILVGSGPFEAKYAKNIPSTRRGRLNDREKKEAESLLNKLEGQKSYNPDVLDRFGRLISKADSYKPVPEGDVRIEVRQDIFRNVWPEASKIRASGELLKLGQKIRCHVVAIHGDYDPHPADGVREPLDRVIRDFRFILLKNCGHKPWIEKEAKDQFYEILKKELSGFLQF